jgi:AraC family transcriptional activator of pobA
VDDFHIEMLSQRSLLHGWTIKAHLHEGLAQLIVLSQGGVVASIDGATLQGGAPSALVIPAAATHAFQFEPDSEGYVVTLRGAPADGVDPVAANALHRSVFAAGRLIALDHSGRPGAQILSLLQQIHEEQDRATVGTPLVRALLLTGVMALLHRRLAEEGADERPAGARMDRFQAYAALVETHHLDRWTIADYAEALHMSESTLDRLCRRHGGRSAFRILQDRLALEAKRYLIYSDLPVSQIGAHLGFEDPAYFSRFIRRQTGLAPAAYRSERRRTAGGAAPPGVTASS